MADDPNAAYQAEIVAARDALVPIIGGLDDLEKLNRFSDAAKEFIRKVFALRAHRREIEDRVIAAIDTLNVAKNALVQDGYPNVVKISVPADVAAELDAERRRLLAGFDQLEAESPAAGIVFGAPVRADRPTA